MKQKMFNKLVRDKIPEIIENNGDVPEIEILDDVTYLKKLEEKLIEECTEVISAIDTDSKIEEMADTLEVLYAISDALGVSMKKIEMVRINKQQKRGAFKNKLLLKSTYSKD